MEYGKLFSRSADIVWRNKFLIVLGIIAALAGGTINNGGSISADSSGSGQWYNNPGQFQDFQAEFTGLAVGAIIAIACVLFFIALALWAISTIARGGLIAGVDSIESGEKTGFSRAWSAGWQRVWTLLGIGFIPAIPGLLLFVLGIIALAGYGGIYALFGEETAAGGALAGLAIPLVLLACILVPISLVLAILRNFAERACMLEGLGAIDSYRRGTKVLMSNLGEAIILFVLQIAIFIGLGILLFLPGLFLLLCCCLWPLLLIINGAINAFLSALWTLAWRTWTGRPPVVEKAPAAV